MKRIIALSLALILTLVLCACGAPAAPTESYTPPVQGGFYPATEPTNEMKVEVEAPEKAKFDFVNEDDTAPEIWRRAHQYLCESEGVVIELQSFDEEMTVTLQLNNKTGEYSLHSEEVYSEDYREIMDVIVALNEETQHYYYYEIETDKYTDAIYTDIDIEYYYPIEDSINEPLKMLGNIEHLLAKGEMASVENKECITLNTINIVSLLEDYEHLSLYVDTSTSRLAKIKLVSEKYDDGTEFGFEAIFRYKPVEITIPDAAKGLAPDEEYDEEYAEEYEFTTNFFEIKSPYTYQGLDAVTLDIEGQKIQAGKKASFVEVIDNNDNIHYKVSAAKRTSFSEYDDIDIPPLDSIDPGVQVRYDITYTKNKEEYSLFCAIENTTDKTLPITECEILYTEHDSLTLRNRQVYADELTMRDMITIFGTNYKAETFGLQDYIDAVAFSWEYQDVIIVTQFECIATLSRNAYDMILAAVDEIKPKPASPLTAATFYIGETKYVVGETRIKNIKGPLEPASTWDLFKESSIYRYAYKTDKTIAYFGAAQEDDNSTLCYYKISDSVEFKMSNGLTNKHGPEEYVAVFGQPDDESENKEKKTLTYFWSEEGTPFTVEVTFLFDENGNFQRTSMIEVIDYTPVIGNELQNSLGEYLLEGLLSLGQ